MLLLMEGIDSSSAVIFDHCPSAPQYFLHLDYYISQCYEVYHYGTPSSMELIHQSETCLHYWLLSMLVVI